MSGLRLLRTLRFDATDELVFEHAAAPDEWAVPGGFAFANDTPETLIGKRLQAFRHGFLGLDSFGWSTFVAVAAVSPEILDELTVRLARHFVDRYGAPDLAAALPVARHELDFARSLAEPHPTNTVLAVERELVDEGVRERFRVVKPAGGEVHARVFDIVAGEEEP
ncbi:hypothetical protein HRbin40_01088 [bacterium HR40]|nr:hypothetical protein HRbin40_01088 [bacterium HR40]